MGVLATGCASDSPTNVDPVDSSPGSTLPPTPVAPSGPLDPQVVTDLDLVFADLTVGTDYAALERIGHSGDPRTAWLLADLLRFFPSGPVTDAVVAAFDELTGTTIDEAFPWVTVTNWLIAWDLEAPPGYVGWKRLPFEVIEPGWAPFFDDEAATIDWRHLSWGGVLIDDRPLDAVDAPCPRGCIPALDDPAVTDVAGGSWYPDDGLVFGVVVNGEARAYPKNIMEVHEMVNDTLGGRRVGIPYCTLCGSAQAYYTDLVPDGFDPIELRTTGLLARSNKVMFDLLTYSLFDTFLGEAVSGPLLDAGYRLEPLSVVTSTWGAWKAEFPHTTIVARDGGLGRVYPSDPLQGRDDDGPIFPIGPVDPRLSVQEKVLGVITETGQAIAFPTADARTTLQQGGAVTLEGVALRLVGDGIEAYSLDGDPLPGHEAFWFAWSQFHPDTGVWVPFG